jgi:hypothetical protein
MKGKTPKFFSAFLLAMAHHEKKRPDKNEATQAPKRRAKEFPGHQIKRARR